MCIRDRSIIEPLSTKAPKFKNEGIKTTFFATKAEYLTIAPGTDLKLLFVHSSSTQPDVLR